MKNNKRLMKECEILSSKPGTKNFKCRSMYLLYILSVNMEKNNKEIYPRMDWEFS